MTSNLFTPTLSHFLAVSALLFTIGLCGALLRRNALMVLISLEIMLNAGNLAILAFARHKHDAHGHTLALYVIAVAAAEAAIGLALIVAVFRNRRHADIDRLTSLRN